MDDQQAIALALEEAKAAAGRGEVPVGAVLLAADGSLLARAGNRILERRDPTAHAEMEVMRAAAAALGNERLSGTTLYASLEPCAMCVGALLEAQVRTLVYAVPDEERGAAGGAVQLARAPGMPHQISIISGVREDEARRLTAVAPAPA